MKAQERNSFVGFNVGPAFPFNKFAYTNPSGAYAGLGYSLQLEGGYYFKSRLGIGLSLSEMVFPFLNAPFMRDYLAGDPSISHVEMKSDPYELRNYAIGGLYRLPLSKKFSMNFKLMAGILWASTPTKFIGVDIATDSGHFYYWKTAAKSRQLSALAGTTLHYHLFDHIDLTGGLTFTYAESGFNFYRTDGTSYSLWYKMPALQASAGLNILF